MKLVSPVVWLLTVAALGCNAPPWPGDQGATERLRHEVASGAKVVDFSALAPFKWSRLEVFGPYTSEEWAEKRLGFAWQYRWPGQLEANEGMHFLVFVDSLKVAGAMIVDYSIADMRYQTGSLTRENAHFLVDAHVLVSPEPLFESDLGPGEGIPVIQATRDTLLLYPAPRLGLKPAARKIVKRGQAIQFDSTRYQTREAVSLSLGNGRVDGPSFVRVVGRSFGFVRRITRDMYYGGGRDTVMTLRVTSDARLLQHRAEGLCFLMFGSVVLESRCPEFGDTDQRHPTTDWWVWTPGLPRGGWLLLSDSTARVTGRRF
jgi:hypothetical protein